MQVDPMSSYAPPVDQLLTYGKTLAQLPDTWPNYLELGFGPEHIPDLIRMVADEKLNEADEDVTGWAPMHACRALGQLHAEAAVEPILSLLELFREINDFIMAEIPYVFAMIGPVALPKTFEFAANSSNDVWARIGAVECVGQIGFAWPETRSECVAFLMAQLEPAEADDYDLNSFLIEALVKLQAVEAAPLIEQAFAADSVDEFVTGDWDDVQVSLGLKSAEEVEEKRSKEQAERGQRQEIAFPSIEYSQISSNTSQKSETGARKKAKSKMAKQSRKKNRKR